MNEIPGGGGRKRLYLTQTPSTGLHPSLEESAGKRCLECVPNTVYTVTTRAAPALGWAAMRAILMFL